MGEAKATGCAKSRSFRSREPGGTAGESGVTVTLAVGRGEAGDKRFSSDAEKNRRLPGRAPARGNNSSEMAKDVPRAD